MKQSHDFSYDYKFPVTANETLSEKTAVVTINARDQVQIPANSDKTIYLFYFF